MKISIKIYLCLAIGLLTANTVHADNSLNKHIINAGGDSISSTEYGILTSIAEPAIGETSDGNYNCRVGFVTNYFASTTTTPVATSTPTPQQTGTPSPTITTTPIDDFNGKLIIKKYTYTAPNPIRGRQMKFVVHVQEAVEIEVKMYTTSNKFVLSYSMNCPGPGKYEHQEYVGNLANGVYLLLVKAKNNKGDSDRLVKKIALIK